MLDLYAGKIRRRSSNREGYAPSATPDLTDLNRSDGV